MQSHRPLSLKHEIKGLQDLLRALKSAKATDSRALLEIKGSLICFWGKKALEKMFVCGIKDANWDDFILVVDAEQDNSVGHLAIHTPYVSKIIFSDPPQPIQKLALEHNISIIQP